MFGKELELYEYGTDKYGKPKRGRKLQLHEIELGDPSLQGIIPRSLGYIFHWRDVNAERLKKFRLEVGFFEIYLDKCYDLLRNRSILEVKETTKGKIETLSYIIFNFESRLEQVCRIRF